MSGALIVAGSAIREAVRRRVFAVVLVITASFGVLYVLGAQALFDDVAGGFQSTPGGLDARALAGATILGLAMFGTLFLGAVLGVFLTAGAVRGDAERGLLQPVVVRPLGRRAYLLGRFAAAAVVSGGYVAAAFALATIATGIIGGWWPAEPVAVGLRLAGAVRSSTALCLLGSVFLSATANGICVLMVYGAGLMAGLLGEIGDAIPSPTLQDIANTGSWVLPFEALYRDALRLLVGDVGGLAGAIVQLGPLGGSHDAGPLLVPWVIAYVAGVLAVASAAFARRDL